MRGLPGEFYLTKVLMPDEWCNVGQWMQWWWLNISYCRIDNNICLSIHINIWRQNNLRVIVQISPCEIEWLESSIILSDFTVHSLYILLSNDWKALNSKYLHHVNILKRLIQYSVEYNSIEKQASYHQVKTNSIKSVIKVIKY